MSSNTMMSALWPERRSQRRRATTASFTGAIAGTALSTSGLSGTLKIGQIITSGAAKGTVIISGSGSSWQVSLSQTVSAGAMTATDGGMLNINLTSSSALSGYSAYVDFSGCYYQA